MRRLLPRALATVLVAALLVPVAAQAAPLPTAPAVVLGEVKALSSRLVRLLAWPDTTALQVGDTVHLLPGADAEVGRDGRFTVPLQPTPALRSMAVANGGFVNFELQPAAGGPALAHFTRYLSPGSETWSVHPDEPSAPLDIEVPLESYPSAGWEPCGPLKLVESTYRDTVVGELRTEPDTLDAVFGYGKRADSEIAVGVRPSGKGPWSASGTHHTGNSYESGVKQHARKGEHLLVETPFTYGRFRCSYAPYETTRAIGWKGDSVVSYATPTRGCAYATDEELARQGAGSEFHRKSERAGGWERAAEAFGFAYSARSGYSTNVSADWYFGDEPMHYLCGSDGLPKDAPHIWAGITDRAPRACPPGRPC